MYIDKITQVDGHFKGRYNYDPKMLLSQASASSEEIKLPYSPNAFTLGALDIIASEVYPYTGDEGDETAVDRWMEEVHRLFSLSSIAAYLWFDFPDAGSPCACFVIDVCTPNGQTYQDMAECTMPPHVVTSMVIDFLKRGAPGLNRGAVLPYLCGLGFTALDWIDLFDFAIPVLELFRKRRDIQAVADAIQDDRQVINLLPYGQSHHPAPCLKSQSGSNMSPNLRLDYISAAVELHYPISVIDQLLQCKSDRQAQQIMTTARNAC